MKFPNAYKGVGRLFLSEIFSIIAIICVIFGTVIPVAAVINNPETVELSGSLVGGGLIVIVAWVMLLISFILQIMGISAASQDEPTFKSAMIAVIVAIVVSLVAGFFSKNELISSLLDVVKRGLELCITWYCIEGIKSLAEKCANNDMVERGDTILKLYFGALIISVALNVVTSFMTLNVLLEFVITIAAAILLVVAYLLYVIYLSQAKKMLAE